MYKSFTKLILVGIQCNTKEIEKGIRKPFSSKIIKGVNSKYIICMYGNITIKTLYTIDIY
jgi:hypothetical protein